MEADTPSKNKGLELYLNSRISKKEKLDLEEIKKNYPDNLVENFYFKKVEQLENKKIRKKIFDIAEKFTNKIGFDTSTRKNIAKSSSKFGLGLLSGHYLMIFLHEISHAGAATVLGSKVNKIYFDFSNFPLYIGGRINYSGAEPLQKAIISLAGPMAEVTAGSYLIKKGLKEKNPFYISFGAVSLAKPAISKITSNNDFYKAVTALSLEPNTLTVGTAIILTYLAGYGIYKGSDKVKNFIKNKIINRKNIESQKSIEDILD